MPPLNPPRWYVHARVGMRPDLTSYRQYAETITEAIEMTRQEAARDNRLRPDQIVVVEAGLEGAWR